MCFWYYPISQKIINLQGTQDINIVFNCFYMHFSSKDHMNLLFVMSFIISEANEDIIILD